MHYEISPQGVGNVYFGLGIGDMGLIWVIYKSFAHKSHSSGSAEFALIS